MQINKQNYGCGYVNVLTFVFYACYDFTVDLANYENYEKMEPKM